MILGGGEADKKGECRLSWYNSGLYTAQLEIDRRRQWPDL
jgi:hypothetical protein